MPNVSREFPRWIPMSSLFDQLSSNAFRCGSFLSSSTSFTHCLPRYGPWERVRINRMEEVRDVRLEDVGIARQHLRLTDASRLEVDPDEQPVVGVIRVRVVKREAAGPDCLPDLREVLGDDARQRHLACRMGQRKNATGRSGPWRRESPIPSDPLEQFRQRRKRGQIVLAELGKISGRQNAGKLIRQVMRFQQECQMTPRSPSDGRLSHCHLGHLVARYA